MTARRRRRLALGALVLLLTVLLVVLLYGVMREVLAPWLAQVYGTILTYYRTIPQPVLWMVCVGLGVLILSLIHISEPTRLKTRSRMPSSA